MNDIVIIQKAAYARWDYVLKKFAYNSCERYGTVLKHQIQKPSHQTLTYLSLEQTDAEYYLWNV